MNNGISYRFGKYQSFTSDRMRKNPRVAMLVNRVFGITTIGAYGRQLVFRRLLEHVPMQQFEKILDLGCGGGEFSFMLADAHRAAEIEALDTNREMIGRISETVQKVGIPNLKAFHGKIQDIPKKEYYDLIFAVDVFEHIDKDEMPFRECYERLKKGGFLIIKMPARDQRVIAPESWFGEFNEWKDKEHIGQVYELPDLVERFRKENFRVITSFYSDGLLARAGWELNYFMRKGGAVPHLLTLPLSKMLMKLDRLIRIKKGNYIQVVGQK